MRVVGLASFGHKVNNSTLIQPNESLILLALSDQQSTLISISYLEFVCDLVFGI
jgi:hypothetical protein